jgi:hypothetical protein
MSPEGIGHDKKGERRQADWWRLGVLGTLLCDVYSFFVFSFVVLLLVFTSVDNPTGGASVCWVRSATPWHAISCCA